MKLSELQFKSTDEAKAYLKTLGVARWKNNQFCCPYHADNNPSCYAYPDTIFCFPCQRAATYSQVTMQITGATFAQSVERLKSYMGITEDILYDFKDKPVDNEPKASKKNSIFKPFNRVSPAVIDKNHLAYDIRNPDTLKGNFIQCLTTLFKEGEYVAIKFDRNIGIKFDDAFMMITTRENWIEKGYDKTIQSLGSIAGAYMIPNPIKPERYTSWKAEYDAKHDGVYSISGEDIQEVRHLLVECDYMPTKKQLEAYTVSRLPIRCIVHTGAKSLHAIVDISGKNGLNYGDEVYKRLMPWGMDLDTSCNSKARWCRVPGFIRRSETQDSLNSFFTIVNGTQYLVGFDNSEHAKNIDEWLDIWDKANPQPETILAKKMREELSNAVESGKTRDEIISGVSNILSKVTNENMEWEVCKSDVMIPQKDLPVKSIVIEGTLRERDIMLFGAGSKSKKSFMLMSLALAVSIGGEWLGKRVKKGRVLYCDFEMAHDDFCERFWKIKSEREHIYHDIFPSTITGFDYINFRNHNQNLNTFLEKLVNLAKLNKYDLIIIDPVYKLFNSEEGYDENSNSTVSQALTKLDKIADETKSAILITHHFKKNTKDIETAIDKFSGAGVFGRYPDVILSIDSEEIDNKRYFTLTHTLRHLKQPKDMDFVAYEENGHEFISLVETVKPPMVALPNGNKVKKDKDTLVVMPLKDTSWLTGQEMQPE